MEVLIIGDIHISGKNPPERIDDVTAVQFDKIDEIVDTANEYDVPVICTGDIFHTPIVSNTILTRFGKIINRLKREFYFVLGNHDLQYHDIERIDRTSIGVVWSNNEKIRHIETFHKHYGSNRKWAYIDYGMDLVCPTGAKYLLSHKAIVNDYLVNSESWIADDVDFCQAASDFEKLNLKLILCGHWHRPFTFLQKSTVVINPGPVIRRQIVEREMPRMLLMDLDSMEFDEILLATALPTDEVLRETSLKEELKPIAERIVQFINNIKTQRQIKHGVKFMDAVNGLLDHGSKVDLKVKNKLKEIISILAEKKGDNFNAND